MIRILATREIWGNPSWCMGYTIVLSPQETYVEGLITIQNYSAFPNKYSHLSFIKTVVMHFVNDCLVHLEDYIWETHAKDKIKGNTQSPGFSFQNVQSRGSPLSDGFYKHTWTASDRYTYTSAVIFLKKSCLYCICKNLLEACSTMLLLMIPWISWANDYLLLSFDPILIEEVTMLHYCFII